MIPNIGPMEIAIVLILALIVFGPKKLPSLGRSVGSGLREFRETVTGADAKADEPEQELESEPKRPRNPAKPAEIESSRE